MAGSTFLPERLFEVPGQIQVVFGLHGIVQVSYSNLFTPFFSKSLVLLYATCLTN